MLGANPSPVGGLGVKQRAGQAATLTNVVAVWRVEDLTARMLDTLGHDDLLGPLWPLPRPYGVLVEQS
jgi:hypothetical protein